MSNKTLRAILLVLIFSCGALIVFNYWMSFSLHELKLIPKNTLLLIVLYLALQLLNRRLFGEQNWWNWLYYIGLLGIVFAYFFANENYLSWFLFVVKFGTLFLLVPPVIDFFKLMNSERI